MVTKGILKTADVMVDPALFAAAMLQKSPVIEGLKAGVATGLTAAPIGALVQALRGQSAAHGAAASGIATGVIAGIVGAIAQDLKNKSREAELRYHLANIRSQNPYLFAPPEPQVSRMFTFLHDRAHQAQPTQQIRTGAPGVR